MMEAVEEVGKIEKKDISDLVTCPLCLEYYEKPKLLPCGHSVCQGCLQMYVDKTLEQGTFICPICRSSVTLPADGLDGFTNSFFIVRLQDEYNKLPVDRSCDSCIHDGSTTNATAKCIECLEYLCAECTTAHRKTKLTRAHHVLGLGEEPSIQHQQTIKDMTHVKCHNHAEEAVRYFCTNCQKLICRDCKALDHADHKAITFNEAIKGKREDVRTDVLVLEKKASELSGIIDSISQDTLKLEMDRTSVTNSITHERDKLIQLITQASEKAFDQAVKFMTGELKNKTAESEKTQFLLTQIKSHVAYTEMLLSDGSDVEILDGYNLMKERSTHLATAESVSVPDHRFLALQPILTSSGINAEIASHFTLGIERRQISRSDMQTIRSPGGQCFTGIAFSNNALFACAGGSLHQIEDETKKESAVNLDTEGRAYGVCVDNSSVVVSKRGRGQPVQLIMGDVTARRQVNVTLSFTSEYPAVTLGGEVDGQQTYFITELSSDCAVHHITRNGDILQTYGKGVLKYPYSVAVNMHGVVVADWGLDDVIIFHREGQVKHRLRQDNKLSSHELSGPCGVCCNGEFIFVSSCRTHSVLLFSYSGEFLQTILTQKDGLEYPEDLTASPYRRLAVVNKWRDEIKLYSYVNLLPEAEVQQ